MHDIFHTQRTLIEIYLLCYLVHYISHHISISVQHLSSYWTWAGSLCSPRSITSGQLLQLPERFLTRACQQTLQTLFQEPDTQRACYMWSTAKCLTRLYASFPFSLKQMLIIISTSASNIFLLKKCYLIKCTSSVHVVFWSIQSTKTA